MIIGRAHETQRLERIYQSTEAEMVVLYGRRRVGKTYLIREFFTKKKGVFFQASGIQKAPLKKQLSHFAESLSEAFTHGAKLKPAESWEEAFKTLTQFVQNPETKGKIIIFLDELPWMATPRSGLLEALDYYWNRYWSANSKLILVLCGSSASWLIKNIIYNKGGLHNRCTCEIRLDPFNLIETKSYLNHRGIKLNKDHILDLYMAVGGIPYYLKYVESGLSATENIQKIFFDKKAPLKDEFTKLFQSLFKNADAYIELIKIIAQKKEGVSRVELENLAKLSQGGGRLTARLKQLIHTNFIEAETPWEKQKGEYYKVIDEFSLFHIYWLSSVLNKKIPLDYWLKQRQKPIYRVWAGYAFEAICRKHINQILKALDIKSAEHITAWRYLAKEGDGTQIDLVIDRGDSAITLGEIKLTDQPFVIDKSYAEKLRKKIEIFKKITRTKKQIFLVLISAKGIKKTMYSEEMLNGLVTLESLFKNE